MNTSNSYKNVSRQVFLKTQNEKYEMVIIR